MTLDPHHDPMGQAVTDHLDGKPLKKLRVLSSKFYEDEMPIPYLFRTYDQMPHIEQTALNMCQGKTLDIGACAGCHSLYLQQRGLDVTAVDISPLSVEAMKRRGINRVLLADMFADPLGSDYDTVLLLMNGTTIAGTIGRLPLFLQKLKALIKPQGQILIDSTDIRYIYEDEDGNFSYDGSDYYGQVDYRMQYGKVRGERFDCLYVDPHTMKELAHGEGLNPEIVAHNDEGAYLMRLTLPAK